MKTMEELQTAEELAKPIADYLACQGPMNIDLKAMRANLAELLRRAEAIEEKSRVYGIFKE